MEQRTDPTAPPSATSSSSAFDGAIGDITTSVNALTESLSKTYEKLTYAGFVSVTGAILIFVPLILGRTWVNFSLEEQRLYVLTGVAFVLIGVLWLTIQNLLIYKLQLAKQDVACRMLAIRVVAMGRTQADALKAIGEAPGAELSDDPFNVK